MNLKYKILAVLAAGIALTACGGSGTPASTPRIQCSAGLVPCGRRRRYGTDQSADMDTG